MADEGISKNRGGRPSERDEPKRSSLTMRTTPDVKDALQAAADRGGRSLAQEIEQRLERSLELEDQFGRPDTFGLVLAIVSTIKEVEEWTGQRWSEEQVTFHATVDAITEAVRSRQPQKLVNQEAILSTIEELKAAEARRDALRAQLVAVGAWPESGVDPRLEPLMRLGSSAVSKRRGLFGAPLLSQLAQSPAAIKNEPAGNLLGQYIENREGAAAPLRTFHRRQADTILADGLTDADGNPLPREIVVGIAEQVLELGSLEAEVTEKRAAFLAAYKPQEAAAMAGAALVARKRQSVRDAIKEAGRHRHGA